MFRKILIARRLQRCRVGRGHSHRHQPALRLPGGFLVSQGSRYSSQGRRPTCRHRTARQQGPDTAQRTQVLDALRSSPTPILIHSKAGADRSGLASALYELEIAAKTPEVAVRQLSFAYGHFPWLGSPSAAMNRTFWNYVRNPAATALGKAGS